LELEMQSAGEEDAMTDRVAREYAALVRLASTGRASSSNGHIDTSSLHGGGLGGGVYDCGGPYKILFCDLFGATFEFCTGNYAMG
jgi:hypothetical protein